MVDSTMGGEVSLPELRCWATLVYGSSSRQREKGEGSGRVLTEVETDRRDDGYGRATENGCGRKWCSTL
jgi:hypothetical protein